MFRGSPPEDLLHVIKSSIRLFTLPSCRARRPPPSTPLETPACERRMGYGTTKAKPGGISTTKVARERKAFVTHSLTHIMARQHAADHHEIGTTTESLTSQYRHPPHGALHLSMSSPRPVSTSSLPLSLLLTLATSPGQVQPPSPTTRPFSPWAASAHSMIALS